MNHEPCQGCQALHGHDLLLILTTTLQVSQWEHECGLLQTNLFYPCSNDEWVAEAKAQRRQLEEVKEAKEEKKACCLLMSHLHNNVCYQFRCKA